MKYLQGLFLLSGCLGDCFASISISADISQNILCMIRVSDHDLRFTNGDHGLSFRLSNSCELIEF